MWLSRLKLKHQIALLIGISVLMIIVVQLVYYIRFYSLTQIRARSYAANTMEQVADKMASIDRNIKQAAEWVSYNENVQKYLTEQNLNSKHELGKIAADMIEYVKILNENIEDIWLINTEGEEMHSYTSSVDYGVSRELKEQYRNNHPDLSGQAYTASVQDAYRKKFYYAYVLTIYSVLKGAIPFEKIGTCVIICENDDFQSTVRSIHMTSNSLFLTLDHKHKVIAANDESVLGGTFKDFELRWEEGGTTRRQGFFDENHHIIQKKQLANPEWEIVSILPVDELTSDLHSMRSFSFIACMVMVFVLLVIGFVLNRNITTPIVSTIKWMEEIGSTDIKKRLEPLESKELGKLVECINKMLDKIDEMTDEVLATHTNLYQVELAKKQARLLALQSQINPHFLYNTLECMRSIALAHGVMENVNIAVALAKIFRYSIKEADLVQIKDELGCIQDYLSIINIRYMGKFSVIFDVEEALLCQKTLKMILQPIVENAIYHGLERKNGKGCVSIIGRKEGDTICFEIVDDGKGMTKDELDSLGRYLDTEAGFASTIGDGKKYVGLVNINDRLKLAFGSQYGIRISSRENVGTKVTISMPVIEDTQCLLDIKS